METDTAAPKAESAPNYAPVVTTESREIGRPIAFDGDKLESSMSKIFDDIQAREAKTAKAQPSLPEGAQVVYQNDRGETAAVKSGETIRDTMEAAYEWANKPANEKKEIAEAHNAVKELRAEAEKNGLTLEEAEALKQSEAANKAAAQSEYTPIADNVQRLYPGEKPTETIQKWAHWAEHIQKNGEDGYLDFLEAAGVDFDKLGRAALQRESTRTVERFRSQHADFDQHAEAVRYAIELGKVRRTGNPIADLSAAYDYVKGLFNERQRAAMQAGALHGGNWENTMRMAADALMPGNAR